MIIRVRGKYKLSFNFDDYYQVEANHGILFLDENVEIRDPHLTIEIPEGGGFSNILSWRFSCSLIATWNSERGTWMLHQHDGSFKGDWIEVGEVKTKTQAIFWRRARAQ